MDLVLNLILTISFVGLLFGMFMLIRNNVVYRIRTKIIDEDYNTYKRLPTYYDMMYQWRMWNTQDYLTKYREEPNED